MSLVQNVNALTTVDGCVFSLVQHVRARTTVDGYVCVSGGTCHGSDHCECLCLCLLCNRSVL